ncbi:MAG: hypothetical protein ACE5IM_00335 [Nitrospinota bacterium]
MGATETTRAFKVAVILALESSGLGYDTRYRFYQRRFPDMDPEALARRVCDPVEYHDRDWKSVLAGRGPGRGREPGRDEEEVLAEFVTERDALFRHEAKAAIYCYDEAGFGSGVNSMRFLRDGKPILGFYGPESRRSGMNLTNVIQLGVEHPDRVTLVEYRSIDEVPPKVIAWLRGLRGG